MDIVECGTQYFDYQDQEEVTKYGLNKLMCFKDDNYTLQGDFYSRDFQYLEMRVYKCQNTSSFTGCASD